MIQIKLVCVHVGHPGDGDQYELLFHDTETDESCSNLVLMPDGSMRLAEEEEIT